ncbi:MAG: mechanosensitive ion channel family protein [Verrucomicrobiia bacterium]
MALSRRRPFRTRDLQESAKARLKKFRKGSILAVALTGMLLMLWGQEARPAAEGPVVPAEQTEPALVLEPVTDPGASLEQATNTIRDLLLGFYGLLPKVLIALILLALAALAGKLARALLQRFLGRWERTEAIAALLRIVIFVAAIAGALSIMAGDVRALLGSIGLVGLALSWALQTPIESFTGWLLNSFRSYYRVGDRIEVGDVFGDVYKIDVLTTTVWEAGGPGKAVAGAQSTGAMITFPNWEVLRSNVVNYSREFPYVWDEVTIGIANESDLAYATRAFEEVAQRVVGPLMLEPVQQYRQLLERAKVAFDVDEEPRVFLSLADAWTNCVVRYLVPARARRRWSTALILALTAETARPEHRGKIIPAYPRTEVQVREHWPGAPREKVDGE